MTAGQGSRGRFITLEGGEGAGKSTQARLLADWLTAQGHDVLLTREPGGAPGAEAVRSLLVEGAPERWGPMTEVLLHMAARSEHISRTLWPALNAGRWVICDRFVDSTRAYQGAGQGVDPQIIDHLHKVVFGNLLPDVTLFLDLPEEQGLNRARQRGGEDRYDRFGAAFHARLRRAFRHLAEAEPDRFAVIRADQPVEAVQAQIRQVLRDRVCR
ncbi:MAG: dTMP kinase [Rhodothalassiaceae bacterium]